MRRHWSIVRCKLRFAVVNGFGMDHLCDVQTDRRRDVQNCDGNSQRLTMCASWLPLT